MAIFFKPKKQIGICEWPQGLVLAELIRPEEKLNYLGEIHCALHGGNQNWKAIKSEIQSRVPRNSPLIMSIPVIKVLKKTIFLSKELTETDVAIHIQWEGENYFPDVDQELSFDFIFCPRKEGASENEIHLFAVRKEEITMRESFAKHMGLDLLAVEPDSYSALRFLLSRKPIEELSVEPVAFLTQDIDKRWRLVLFNHEEVLFSHILLSSDLRRRLLQIFCSSPDKATRKKAKKLFIPSHDREAYLKEIGQPIELFEVEYLSLFENNMKHPHYCTQVAFGLALRGCDDHH